MNLRYYITFKHWDGNTVHYVTTSLGRFSNQESAELHARIRFAGAERIEITGVRPETRVEAAMHNALRFVIRTFRICCGIALAFFAYSWTSAGNEVGNIPFSSLTLNMLISAIGRGLLFVGGLYASWHVAFGEGSEQNESI